VARVNAPGFQRLLQICGAERLRQKPEVPKPRRGTTLVMSQLVRSDAGATAPAPISDIKLHAQGVPTGTFTLISLVNTPEDVTLIAAILDCLRIHKRTPSNEKKKKRKQPELDVWANSRNRRSLQVRHNVAHKQ
jgi:hypothetical protein